MSGNLFGQIFKVMTFGESHGPYIGLVIDGIKPNIPVDVNLIQEELNRRRPGQTKIATSRQEKDKAEVISGIFEGKTTGTPICILIKNEDQRPSDYKEIKNILRPGHASFTYLKKYGIFDYRGGGRSSGRETATRVAAGAIAKQVLNNRGIYIIGYTRKIDGIEINKCDLSMINQNNVKAPDLDAAKKMEAKILEIKKEGDSLGGIVEIVVKNCPAGLGEPVFQKLEADLASALMSIGAVKGFEIGTGFRSASQKGSQHNDEYYFDNESNAIKTRTNNSGGVLGGITNGEDLIMRIAVKPPSSIQKQQKTVNTKGENVDLRIEGRHDPCICPRIIPVAEAMVALVLLDHILMQDRITASNDKETFQSKIEMIDLQILLLFAQRIHWVKKFKNWEKRKSLQTKKYWKEISSELGINHEFMGKLQELVERYSE